MNPFHKRRHDAKGGVGSLRLNCPGLNGWGRCRILSLHTTQQKTQSSNKRKHHATTGTAGKQPTDPNCEGVEIMDDLPYPSLSLLPLLFPPLPSFVSLSPTSLPLPFLRFNWSVEFPPSSYPSFLFSRYVRLFTDAFSAVTVIHHRTNTYSRLAAKSMSILFTPTFSLLFPQKTYPRVLICSPSSSPRRRRFTATLDGRTYFEKLIRFDETDLLLPGPTPLKSRSSASNPCTPTQTASVRSADLGNQAAAPLSHPTFGGRSRPASSSASLCVLSTVDFNRISRRCLDSRRKLLTRCASILRTQSGEQA